MWKLENCSVWSVFFHKANPSLLSLGKVLVEESVEDRVGACAGHTEHVTDEEGQHHLFCKTTIKGIVQPFELGGETRLIRSAVKK